MSSNGDAIDGQQLHTRERTTEIRLHPHDWSILKGVKDHKTALLGTLFHESIHAYFADSCCKTQDVAHLCKYDEGSFLWAPRSQHPFAFICLAAGVQIALDKLLDLGTDLAVLRSLIMEYTDTKRGSSAAQWRIMFELYSWSGVDSLVCKLQGEEFGQLGRYLALNEGVVDVFQEEFERERSGQRKKKEVYDAALQKLQVHKGLV